MHQSSSSIVSASLHRAVLLALWVFGVTSIHPALGMTLRSDHVDARWETWCIHHDGTACWLMDCGTIMEVDDARTIQCDIPNPPIPPGIGVWQMSPEPAKAPPTVAHAHAATATASSAYSDHYLAACAVDANPSTRWSSGRPYGKNEWLQLDLNTVQKIGRIEIDWETAFAKGYQVSTSNDAKTWTTIHTTGAGDGTKDILNGLNATGRHLRLDCLERGTGHGYSIHEIKVYPDALPDGDQRDGVIPNDPTYQAPVEQDMQKEFNIGKRYLNVPLLRSKEAAKKTLRLTIDGELLGEFGAPLAPGKPDYFGFFDLSQHVGKKMALEVDRFAGNLDAFTMDDVIRGAQPLYRENYRPQFHFTSQRGWLNDPNGLIYHDGIYHLYYQYNPLSTFWGNMSWGHATSTDLVHWTEQPAVLYPNPETGACFSGAAFLDRWNHLGQKRGNEDILVAFYLRTRIGLALAWSNDGGMSFTDYEGNPVLTHAGARIDTPRPFWHQPTKRWVAPTYDFYEGKDGKRLRAVGFYSSANLRDWKYESRVEQGEWGDELCGCVDFFQLPVDGDANNKPWVMIMIDGSYIIGDFDGRVFRNLDGNPAVTRDRIRSLVRPGNFYATMTWHNMPGDRRVQTTWMKGGDYPGMPFSQQLTIPAELTLHATSNGPQLRMNPIEELHTLRTKTHAWNDITLKPGANPLATITHDLIDLEVEFTPSAGAITEFDMRGTKVTYDCDHRTLTCGRVSTPLSPVDGRIHLRILLDRASVEVFANHGRTYIPLVVFPDPDNRAIKATATRNSVPTHQLQVHELKSAWHQ